MVPTVTRKPRMQGFPPITFGSRVMRECSAMNALLHLLKQFTNYCLPEIILRSRSRLEKQPLLALLGDPTKRMILPLRTRKYALDRNCGHYSHVSLLVRRNFAK